MLTLLMTLDKFSTAQTTSHDKKELDLTPILTSDDISLMPALCDSMSQAIFSLTGEEKENFFDPYETLKEMNALKEILSVFDSVQDAACSLDKRLAHVWEEVVSEGDDEPEGEGEEFLLTPPLTP